VTIKRQFHLLIAGIVLLPFLAFSGFVVFLKLTRENKRLAAPVYMEVAPLLPDSLNAVDWDNVTRFLRYIRPDTDIAVMSRDLMIIFSTIEELPAGTVVPRETLFALMEKGGADYRYIFEIPPWNKGENFFVIQRIGNDAMPPKPPVFAGLAFFILIILFVIIMSVIILRAITRSVLTLEAATARIADGELDIDVAAGGSNEITSLAHSLNRMRLTIKEQELRRSRFIMGVTHDLKTPLSLIKGYAEAIEDGLASDPATLRQSTGIISAKVEQLEGMVDDLLDFVRLDSREWRLAMRPVRLRAFLTGFAGRVQKDAALLGRGVSVDVAIDDALEVPLDERLIQRALENMVNNAIRYTGEGGRVALSAYMNAGRVFIDITDDGPGIKREDAERVFEMFYRGSGSRREAGMGMGLAVVKTIIELHGWKVEAVSPPPGGLCGACFRITIPLSITLTP